MLFICEIIEVDSVGFGVFSKFRASGRENRVIVVELECPTSQTTRKTHSHSQPRSFTLRITQQSTTSTEIIDLCSR